MWRYLQAASLTVLMGWVWPSNGFAQNNRSVDQAIFYVANTRPPDAFLSLRTHPKTSRGQRIAKMSNGTALRVIEQRPDGWWYVRVIASGQEGWALAYHRNRTWIDCCITVSEPSVRAPADYIPVGFKSPSGNIHCQAFAGRGTEGGSSKNLLRCDVLQMSSNPPPRPPDCESDWGQAFEIRQGDRLGQRICYSGTVHDEKLLTLSYGETWERLGFKCKSDAAGVTCTNSAGHGFELSRSVQRVF
jgi:Bacterial SH3 domain